MKQVTTAKFPLLLATAFLLGVGGTAAVLLHRPLASPAAPRADIPRADTDAEPASDKPGSNKEDNGADAAQSNGLIELGPAAVKNAGIRVEAARLSTLRAALVAPGTVEAVSSGIAKITPPVTGKVTRLFVGLGDAVRAGQPLATLDSLEVAQAQAAVRQAASAVRQAQARVQTAGAEMEQARDRARSSQQALRRQTALARAGAFTQAPLQAAQSEQLQAQSELLQAQAELQNRTTEAQRNERLFAAGIIAQRALERAQTDLRQSQIRVDQAQARVNLARQTLTRERSVFRQGLLSQQGTQTAEAEARAAQADVRRAQTEAQSALTALAGARDAVTSARVSLRAILGPGRPGGNGQIVLLSPLNGVVSERAATLGEAVERSTAVMVIQNLRSVTVQANVPEAQIARVRVGQPVVVTVASYPGKSFPGVVQSLGSRVDDKTRTLPVRCLVPNSAGRLRPDMFAQVSLATDTPRPALLLPASAVVDNNGQKAVYVAEGSGYRKRAVTVGPTSGGQVEVRSGLRGGERVVVAGAFVLESEAHKGDLKESD